MSDLTQPSCFSRFFSKKSSKTEVEIIEPVTMELYIKAGPEDGQVGDCPFAHYVRCVMHFKGLDCKVIPCKPETKPEWLLNDPDLNGKMPCLKKDDFKLTESGAISEFIEKTHPEPSLKVDNMDKATEVQSAFFPAMAKLVKSTKPQADLEKAFIEQAKKLNDHLESQNTKYFSGENISLIDFSVSPKLYHMDICLAEFHPKVHEKVMKMKALKTYMDVMFAHEAFQATLYPKETILWGWSAARGK